MDHQKSRKSSICARTWLVLAYSAVFGFPLSTEEVRRRYWLLGEEIFPTHKDIETSLTTLAKIGWIKKRGEWWHLSSQLEAPRNRAEWLRYSEQKLIEAQPILSFLSKLPWVLAVAITGSVAVNSAKKDDDVDFMIITEPNRLWITRLLTLIFAMKHGKRRSFAKEEPNSWCFNLWLTTETLHVPVTRRSLYSAYEVCQTTWMFSRQAVKQKFLKVNTWVNDVLPSYYQWRRESDGGIVKVIDQNMLVKMVFTIAVDPLLLVLEKVTEIIQRCYMKQHLTNELVTSDRAFFHPIQRHAPILHAIFKNIRAMNQER